MTLPLAIKFLSLLWIVGFTFLLKSFDKLHGEILIRFRVENKIRTKSLNHRGEYYEFFVPFIIPFRLSGKYIVLSASKEPCVLQGSSAKRDTFLDKLSRLNDNRCFQCFIKPRQFNDRVIVACDNHFISMLLPVPYTIPAREETGNGRLAFPFLSITLLLDDRCAIGFPNGGRGLSATPIYSSHYPMMYGTRRMPRFYLANPFTFRASARDNPPAMAAVSLSFSLLRIFLPESFNSES